MRQSLVFLLIGILGVIISIPLHNMTYAYTGLVMMIIADILRFKESKQNAKNNK